MRAGDRIVPGIRAFLAERGEDAWLREGGMLKVATTAAQEPDVDRAVAAAAAVGHAEEAVRVEEPGISPVFRRGVRYRDGATVHPARLVRGAAPGRARRRRAALRTVAGPTDATTRLSRSERRGARAGRRRRDERGGRGMAAGRAGR